MPIPALQVLEKQPCASGEARKRKSGPGVEIKSESAMLQSNPSARIVLTTTASAEEARRLGRALVEERLAACVTLLPAAHSIYRWQGAIESADECLLLVKTAAEKLAALEARLRELHSYETPEFLALPVEAGSEAYLEWIEKCVHGD